MKPAGLRKELKPALLRLLRWLAPLTALGIALLPTLLLGFPRGHDWLLELTRIAEYRHAVGEGQIPPHWAPNIYGGSAGGVGAPVFLFYSPLYLIVASAAVTVVSPMSLLPLAAGARLAIWIFAAAGLLAMADLLRSLGSGSSDETQHGSGARIAAMLFVLHPYFLTDALLRNANAEFAALCLLPLPLSGVVRLASGRRGAEWRLGLGLALVVLAHNLTALIAAAAVVVLGVVLLWDAERQIQVRFAASFVAGLLLSSWLWLPALGYRHLIRQSELTRGKLDFHQNFGPIFGWGAYFAVGWLPALLLVGALAWLLVRRPTGPTGRVAWTLSGASGVFLFLQTPASIPIWEQAPFLPLFQFPFRFQGPLALCVAVLAALAWSRISFDWRTSRKLIVEWLVLVLLVLNAWPHLSNVRPLPEQAFDNLTAWTTPNGIRTQRLKVTVGDEYLPAPGVDPASLPYGAATNPPPPLRLAGLCLAVLTVNFWILIVLLRRRRRILTASSSSGGPTESASI